MYPPKISVSKDYTPEVRYVNGFIVEKNSLYFFYIKTNHMVVLFLICFIVNEIKIILFL